MSGGLAIFVKTPGLSPLKTRLAAVIGREAAETWYRLAAKAVLQAAQSVDGIEVAFAVAEDSVDAAAFWRQLCDPDSPVSVVVQGQGSLGHRMAAVHEHLISRHGFAILVGADTPQLSSVDLRAACNWLDSPEPRLCLGPASDGGFWLFGGNRPLPLQAWLSPRYSAPETAREFRRAMQGQGDWLDLGMLTDVDTAADFRPAIGEMHALQTPHPGQCDVLHWMRSNPIDWP